MTKVRLVLLATTALSATPLASTASTNTASHAQTAPQAQTALMQAVPLQAGPLQTVPLQAVPLIMAAFLGPGNHPSLEVESLSKRFRDSAVLTNISAFFRKKEIVGIIGPNDLP